MSHDDPSDQLIYGISHDLRGPLLNFQGFLRRLRNGCDLVQSQAEHWNLTSEQRRVCNGTLEQKVWSSLQILDQNARRMERLVDALLKVSRAGREPVQPEHLRTEEMVRNIACELRGQAACKAELVVGALPDLWADPTRMVEIFRHLLGNALKFLHRERTGLVTVGGTRSDGEDICWVRDNGIGIRSQEFDHLFVPFGRLREIDVPGEGIGLAIVHKLLRQQGGRVWVESVHGEGSTFYLALPTGAAP